jgi:energy-coupling factor transporter ATP-binding protein EcfA2
LVEVAMHVAKIQISGVRGFHGDRAVDLDLTRPNGSLAGWTVIAGRNGSGKSTLLQALALVLAGPQSVGFVPSLSDWMSAGVERAEISADLRAASSEPYQTRLFDSGGSLRVWLRLNRPRIHPDLDADAIDPDVTGEGVASFRLTNRSDPEGLYSPGWFYAGYGPFRHLGGSGNWKPRKKSVRSSQISSLFDDSISLADAVDWLIEQHLYQLENRAGARDLMDVVMTLLADGLLPDDFRVCRVDSDGLWVSREGSEFPLREMSDGYRAVTALIVDIIRQLQISFGSLRLSNIEGVPTLPYPGVVLIDEVDTHLHVSWQQAIGTWLKKHFPEIQFIVTSHSPYICQSADPGGLILLPGPGDRRAGHVVGQDLYERVVYGSGDDAVLTELFGVSTPYSEEAVRLRRRLGDLETKVLDGSASDVELEEFRSLRDSLSSSLGTRAAEIAARLGRDSDPD